MAIAQTGSKTATGTSAAPAITHGLTINAGDIIIAVLNVRGGSQTITDNNGSTPFTNTFQENSPGSTASSRYAIQIRVAGASEPATYNWTVTSSAIWSITLSVHSGVDNTTPWDVQPSTSTRTGSSSDGTTATAPTMTTATNGAMGIAAFLTDTSGMGGYSGITNGYGAEIEPPADSVMMQSRYNRLWATAGATGTTAATLSSSNDWVAHQFALKPAGATAYTINAASGSYALSGVASTPLADRMVNADAGVYALVGNDASLLADRLLVTEAGVYLLTGSNTGVLASRLLVGNPGVYTLEGVLAVLEVSGISILPIGTVPVRYVVGQIANVVPVETVLVHTIGVVSVREFVGPAHVVPVREAIGETPRVKVRKV